MVLSLNLEDPLTHDIYFCGIYEPHTTAFMMRRLRDPRLQVVYDGGSYIGYYAIMAALFLRGRGYVEVFEPVPRLMEQIQNNRLLNKLENVSTHLLALGQYDKAGLLYLPHGSNKWSSQATLSQEAALAWSKSGSCTTSISVQIVTLDTMVQKKRARIPDLIRLDVESCEPQVLQGASYVLKTYLPDLVLEVLSPQIAKQLSELLGKLGYNFYWIGPRGWLRSEGEFAFVPKYWDHYASCRDASAYLFPKGSR